MRTLPLWLLLAACTHDEPEPAPTDADEDGYAAEDDCNDGAPAIHPGAVELCDGIDQDCDGSTEDEPTSVFFRDEDQDGFGDPGATVSACGEGPGVVANGADCDDGDDGVNPEADETCDGVDSNCADGESDASDARYWYADADGDGYGTGTREKACSLGEGYATASGDCDDTADAVFPGADELCNDVDDDCDRDVDEDAIDGIPWYADVDGDGWGDASSVTVTCTDTGFEVGVSGDCDDADATAFPGAAETCDGDDDDCDGTVDEEATDATTWYADVDEDGFGAAADRLTRCEQPAGYVGDATDCDDADASAYPGAPEICDAVDNDCDGDVDPVYVEADFDATNPLALNGSATWDTTGPGGVLRLVSAADEAGTAWYGVVPGTRFQASFLFSASGDAGGEGVAFALLDSTDTSALGTGDVYGVGGLTGFAIAFDTATDEVRAVDASTGASLDSASTATLLDGGWHEVAITFDAGALDVSLDGSGVLSTTLASYALTQQLVGVSAGTAPSSDAPHEVDDLLVGCP